MDSPLREREHRCQSDNMECETNQDNNAEEKRERGRKKERKKIMLKVRIYYVEFNFLVTVHRCIKTVYSILSQYGKFP